MNDVISASQQAPIPHPTMEDALACFRKYWGFEQFKTAQGQLIGGILDNIDQLGVLPTGYGKSAVFQVLALILPGTVLVISPLIALMKDQVDDCLAKGIPASFINSHVDEEEIDDRLTLLRRGEYKLFYVAPERMGSGKFRDSIQMTHVSLVTVDECHCASRWGHDFRPAYMKIKTIVQWLESGSGRPPILAVTATATKDIEADIVKAIGLENHGRVVGDPVRENLKYSVLHGNSWKNFENVVSRFRTDGSRYVVYAGTRAGSERLAAIIQEKNFRLDGKVGVYHAGLSKQEREDTQDRFKSGKLPVVVATNAFGMGIDVPNIRAVVHFGIPGSIEDYCQEGGRGGRDGLPSDLFLIHSDYAEEMRTNFMNAANPKYETFELVWMWLHKYNDRGAVISLTAEEMMARIVADTNAVVSKEEIGGVLSTLDSYGLVNRRATEAGLAITCYREEMMKKLESGELSTTQTKLVEYLLAQSTPEAPVAPPTTTRQPQGLKAIVKPPDPTTVEIGMDLEACELAINLGESAIRAQLKRLQDMTLLDIGKTFRGKTTQVASHVWGDQLQDHIPKAVIVSKREREEARLDAMIRYCHVQDRTGFIRQYFLGA